MAAMPHESQESHSEVQEGKWLTSTLSVACMYIRSEYIDKFCHHSISFQVKDSNRISGTQRTTCPYFDELDAILGIRAASTPAVLLESSGTEEASGKCTVISLIY